MYKIDLTTYGSLPLVLASLRESRAKILDLIEGHSTDALTWRPAQDGWSVAMVLEHLMLAEQAAVRAISLLGRVARGERELRPIVVQPGGWRSDGAPIAPDIVSPRGELSWPATLEAYERTRHQVLDMAATYHDVMDLASSGPTIPHPFFGDLDALGWLRMLAHHERHHINQIETIFSQQHPLSDSRHTIA